MKRQTATLICIVLALVLIGILMVYSAGTMRLYKKELSDTRDVFSVLYRQLTYVGAGLVLMFLLAGVDYKHYAKPAVLIGMFAVTVVLLVVVLVYDPLNGARRWIPIFGYTFQPAELAKLTAIILLAVMIAASRKYAKEMFRGTLKPLVFPMVLVVFILLERDLGIPAIIWTVSMLMLVLGGASLWKLAGLQVPALGLFVALILPYPHRVERILAYREPWKYRDAEALQLIYSMAGFSRGAIFGEGLGAGQQKLPRFLFAAESDFIFSVWGEETGLIGTLTLVLLFTLFVIVALRIVFCAPDLLGALLAAGVTFTIATQAALNMAVATGLVPTKGLPLPFISSGGTALLVNLASVGILINVGLHCEERAPGKELTLTSFVDWKRWLRRRRTSEDDLQAAA